MENTDENHTLSSGAIKDKLADYGIEAEEHSIRRDITMLQELFESAAEQDLLPETLSKLDYEIEYDASLKGYKITEGHLNWKISGFWLQLFTPPNS